MHTEQNKAQEINIDLQQLHQSELSRIREMINACMQCGTCTASCPNAYAMDYPPRRLWRLVMLGQTGTIFHSRTFWLCSSCHTCTLRCPRGLPLSRAIEGLKQMAVQKKELQKDKDSAFYEAFIQNIRKNGRIEETKLMLDYLKKRKSILLALSYTPLGLKFLRKGKIKILPARRDKKFALEALFQDQHQKGSDS